MVHNVCTERNDRIVSCTPRIMSYVVCVMMRPNDLTGMASGQEWEVNLLYDTEYSEYIPTSPIMHRYSIIIVYSGVSVAMTDV